MQSRAIGTLCIVAKKHGYANWRTCYAILGDVSQTLADPLRERIARRLAEPEQPPTVVRTGIEFLIAPLNSDHKMQGLFMHPVL